MNKQEEYTWEKILDIFIRDIERQKYGKDQKIPTESETAVKYGVGRSEIRIVYKKLREMGYIYSIRGCGTFCCGKRIKIPLDMGMGRGASFSLKMKELGLPYRTENIEARTISKKSNIYQTMNADPTDIIWKIVLLRFIDEKPVAIHTRYMNQRYFPNLPEDASQITSSRTYLRENGYEQICGKNGQMAITPISKKKRLLLNMQYQQEALVLTGLTLSKKDNCILESFCTTYQPDCFLFTFS